ncbi:uncharacterized protein [Branchiostoma lanceolatum]|uniref:uncharacterized protein n=1 Tax=Branchiostoma lanceolatum TaxID=7740 RepID=UPI0034514F50
MGVTVLDFRNGSVIADIVLHVNKSSGINESHVRDAFTQGIQNNPGSNTLNMDPADLCYKPDGETAYCSSVVPTPVKPTEGIGATSDQMFSGAVVAAIALAALVVILIIAAIFAFCTRHDRGKDYESKLEAKNPWWENSCSTVEARGLSRYSESSIIINDYGFKY